MLYSWDVIGHDKELIRLEEDILSKNLHHAYLFVGLEKVGKYRVARTLAKILQCPNNFCHSCPTCVQVEKRIHPDTIELEDDGGSIKIASIRDITARLNMTPQSNYKILLISNIGRFTDEAGNALLKTLEEPPAKTLFLFTATHLKDIMPTIASRVRTIYFRATALDILRAELRKRYPELDEETLKEVLMLSLGRSGRAIQLISEPDILRELRELYDTIHFLEEKASLATRIMLMQELSGNEKRLDLFLTLLVHHLRQRVMESGSPAQRIEHTDKIERIHAAKNLMGRNVNSRLLLEDIMIHL